MSNHLITMAYKADLRTPMRKAVMVLLADKASDDGSGIWASKQTMADELCCTKQSVINTIKAFIDEGLLVEDGQRRNPNGYTTCYRIVIDRLEGIERVDCWKGKGSTTLTGQTDLPVKEIDATSQRGLPKPSTTPHRETNVSPPVRAKGKTCLPADWQPTPLDELPPQARACAEQWTAESYATHGEAFVSYWRSTGRKMADWRLTWANRIVSLHSQVMRDQKFGNAPPAAQSGKGAMTDADRRAVFDRRCDKARQGDAEALRQARGMATAWGFEMPDIAPAATVQVPAFMVPDKRVRA